VIFLTTIAVTLVSDLLLGIAAGIVLKFILHMARGVSFSVLFNPKMSVVDATIRIEEAAVFSNFMPIKKKLISFDLSSRVTIDFQNCNFIDHSVIEILYHIKDDFEVAGGELIILGIDELKPVGSSKHPNAAQRRKK
jgi:MFS superfamily sulfate permease-like transporter